VVIDIVIGSKIFNYALDYSYSFFLDYNK